MNQTFRTALVGALAALLLLPSCATQRPATQEQPVTQPQATSSPRASDQPINDIDLQLREYTLSYDEQGRLTGTDREVYRMLSGDPAEYWKVLKASYRPGAEAPPELRARVIAPDGTVVELDQKTISDAAKKSALSDVFTDDHERAAPLPAIAPGSLIDRTIVTKELKPFAPYGTSTSWWLSTGVPIKRERVVVEYPSSLALKVGLEGVDQPFTKTETNGVTRLVLERTNIKPFENPERLVPAGEQVYARVVAATGQSWNAIAKGYGAAVADRLRADEALVQTAKSVTATASTREQKVAAVLRWLREHVRYTGLEIREASIIPYTPKETLERRYGDCKDMSALMVAMLRAVGVDATLALLSTGIGEDIPTDLPGMGLFNHAIVAVDGKTTLWVDPTDQFAAPGFLSSGVQARRALVIKDSTTKLTTTPEMTVKDSVLTTTIDVTLQRAGYASWKRVRQGTGMMSADRRQAFFDSADNAKKRWEKWQREEHKKTKTIAISTSNPLDFEQPFSEAYEVTNHQAGYTNLEGASVTVTLDDLIEELPIRLDDPDDRTVESKEDEEKQRRKHSYVFPQAYSAEVITNVIVPSGYALKKAIAPLDRIIGPVHLTMNTTTRPDGAISMRVRLESGPRVFTATQFDTVKNELMAVLREIPNIEFENTPLALAEKGRITESLAAIRSLLKAEPKEPMHHATFANVLLSFHAGTAAIAEGKRLVELAPSSAVAHRVYGTALAHDALGTWLGKDFDREGAITELKKALTLDPDDGDAMGSLLSVYLTAKDGRWLGSSAAFNEALPLFVTYREKHGTGNDSLYAQTLMKLGKYDELIALAPKLSLDVDGAAARLCALTIKQGGANAYALIKREYKEKYVDEITEKATRELFSLQRYPEIMQLIDIEQTESGRTQNATERTTAQLLRQLKPYQSLGLKADDPRMLLVKVMGVGARHEGITEDDIFTPDATAKERSEYLKAMRASPKMAKALELSPALLLDMTAASWNATVDDTLPFGAQVSRYVSPMAGADGSVIFFTTKHNGMLKLHPSMWRPSYFARAIRDAVKTNAVERAKTLAQTHMRFLAQQDSGVVAFVLKPLFQKALAGGAPELTLYSYAMDAYEPEGLAAAGPLKAALESSQQESLDVRSSLAFSLGNVYEINERWGDIEAMIRSVERDQDLHRRLRSFRSLVMTHTGRFAELRTLLENELTQHPEDPQLLVSLANAARAEGRFDIAENAQLQLIELKKNVGNNLATLALDGVFSTTDAKALDRAERAHRIAANDPNVLAAVAAVYADAGRNDEAFGVLNQRLKNSELKDLSNRSWFAFGRLAESLQLPEVATEAYKRVIDEKDKTDRLPALAKKRLGALTAKH